MSNKTSDKSVANKIKRQAENTIKYYKNMENIEEVSIDILRAMYKDVLAEREQKDKQIKELEEENKKKSIELICYQEELDNSIPKQVVIDKMKELNKEMRSCDEIDAIFKIKQQQILAELLEGEK